MRYLVVVTFLSLSLALSGCASTGGVPASGTRFQLDGCAPFLNCVSSESTLGLYQVDPIHLEKPLDKASWKKVKTVALALPGASLNDVRFGYADITCYSDVFSFPDYLEILVSPDGRSLNVRSQSLIGFYDFGVNGSRIAQLRQRLDDIGVAEPEIKDSY